MTGSQAGVKLLNTMLIDKQYEKTNLRSYWNFQKRR